MDIPPLIQVSHLPSASSFYATLTQPLGLQFLVAAPISPATLHFGFVSNSTSGLRKQTVFTVSESAVPRLSHITLSAPSSKAILEFHQKSTILNREQKENTLVKTAEDERAVTRDFDGNMIEAVYVPRSRGAIGGYQAVTLETASSQKEAKRVLEWQEDVARSISEEPEQPRVGMRTYSQSAPRPGTFQRADTFPRTRPRRDTITSDTFRKNPEERPRDRSPIGISNNAIIGTFVAVAAGSALLCSMINSRPADPPPRRRTSGSHYTHSPIRMEDRETVVETIPARSHVSQRERQDKIAPRYVQYKVSSPVAPLITRDVRNVPRIDNKSYVSVSPSHRSHRSQRERSRSDIGTRYERPLSINPAPPRDSPEREESRKTESHVSRRSHRSDRERSASGGSSGRDRERRVVRNPSGERSESYTSARSHHTASTVKPALPSVPIPPPAASYVSASTVRPARSHISERERERERDRERERRRQSEWDRARMVPLPESVVSARQVPLPRSTVGYEYEASVAPSDSVSSIGVKRERERLKERMRERGLVGRWDA